MSNEIKKATVTLLFPQEKRRKAADIPALFRTLKQRSVNMEIKMMWRFILGKATANIKHLYIISRGSKHVKIGYNSFKNKVQEKCKPLDLDFHEPQRYYGVNIQYDAKEM